MNATKVNAGPAESNGRLLLGIWRDSLHVTCGLTACAPGSAPGPTLGNEYGKTLPFLSTTCVSSKSSDSHHIDLHSSYVLNTSMPIPTRLFTLGGIFDLRCAWTFPSVCIAHVRWNSSWVQFMWCELDVSGVGDDNVMKTLHSLLIIADGAVLMKNYHQEKELKPDSVINIKYITYNSNSNKVVNANKICSRSAIFCHCIQFKQRDGSG